jgi:hypothetical protein
MNNLNCYETLRAMFRSRVLRWLKLKPRLGEFKKQFLIRVGLGEVSAMHVAM